MNLLVSVKKYALFGVALISSFSILAQPKLDRPESKFDKVDQKAIEKHLHVLASPDLQGRGIHQPGYPLAAQYVAQQLDQLGVDKLEVNPEASVKTPGYFQSVPLKVNYIQSFAVSSNGKELKPKTDIAPYQIPASFNASVTEWVFAGYGIEDAAYTSFKVNEALNGKGVIIVEGEPKKSDGNFLISGGVKPSKWSSIQTKLKLLAKKGAIAVLVVTEMPERLESIYQRSKSERISIDESYMIPFAPPTPVTAEPIEISGKSSTKPILQEAKPIPSFYISVEAASKILSAGKVKLKKALSTLKSGQEISSTAFNYPVNFSVTKKEEQFFENNVCAFFKGSTNETVVVTAHLDHLGNHDGKIYPGADDDGSGSATLLAYAEMLSGLKNEGKLPRKNILLVWFTGEESGLLGSEFFSQYPVVPLKSIYCNVNIDMIGRTDPEHEGKSDYIYVIGADKISMDLWIVIREANQSTASPLVLDTRYNDENDPNRYYYRSDHYNFAEKGIPVVFFFKGVHADYHKPTDTVDKIEFENQTKVAQLIFETILLLGDRVEPLKKNK